MRHLDFLTAVIHKYDMLSFKYKSPQLWIRTNQCLSPEDKLGHAFQGGWVRGGSDFNNVLTTEYGANP